MSFWNWLVSLFSSPKAPDPVTRAPTPAPVVPSKPVFVASPIKGVDVYHGDNITNWNTVLKSGFQFVFIKASQGLGSDPNYASNKKNAESAGLITGAYHFISFERDAKEQARHFVDVINTGGGLSKNNLPPVLDFEYLPGRDPKPADAQVAKDFLEELQSLTGRLPIIYLSRSVPGEIGTPAWLAKYPLWLASYNKTVQVPAPWASYTFWQYSESETVPGISNKADGNYFNGSLDDLRLFISKT